jgi:uncharacterized protein YkwD
MMLVAQRYAQLMARKDTMGHSVDGEDAGQRLSAVGHQWDRWGENVGYQFGSGDLATAMFRGWTHSPPHNANLLKSAFTGFGVGVARSATGKYYFCQVFAHPVRPTREWRDTQRPGPGVSHSGQGC